jgi:hypothetical protein
MQRFRGYARGYLGVLFVFVFVCLVTRDCPFGSLLYVVCLDTQSDGFTCVSSNSFQFSRYVSYAGASV